MLQIDTLPLGDYQTNCYIVRPEGAKECLVIDPGYEPEIILSFLKEKGLELSVIALTHGHFDHVGAVRDLAAETGCRVYLDPKELTLPPMLTAGPLYYTDTYADSDRVTLAGMDTLVLETPGHTPGSVCLLIDAHMFAGDTLFAGSCGRTDFPGGDADAEMASLRKLAALPGDYHVLPGHMGASTLQHEREANQYMAYAIRSGK